MEPVTNHKPQIYTKRKALHKTNKQKKTNLLQAIFLLGSKRPPTEAYVEPYETANDHPFLAYKKCNFIWFKLIVV